ncbi:hypothetical protein CK500_05420 [Halorubrum salipaludis]|uniref:DUF8112 domain-containing protein n=1 Tax=Halorubrum salipaludis TaxID=2032630 RepID=A0A2A2FJT9_9EURY|nr:hypothetical protein [Halorubrum salipaludis]PAU84947.1 hypothetical protein CK500_05420 [Halorubrum salipaludis]
MILPTDKLPNRQQLARISLDTRHPICQVCGHSLNESDDITAYAYRAAGEPAYAIGYIMCGADIHEHPTVFTRGVHEYVLTGHVGSCTDSHTQSTTFVLLDPTAVATSPTSTATSHVHADAPTPRDPTHSPPEEPPSLLSVVRERARSDGGASHEGAQ